MKRVWPYWLGMTLYAAGANGNPIASEMIRVRQVPNTLHVQITYGTAASDGTPVDSATRDGAPLAGDWTKIDSFAMNLGSGVRNVSGYQRCDCNLSVGAHEYRVQVQNPNGTTLRASITVAADYSGPTTQPPVGATEAGGMAPWDEPEPTEMQGLDCTVWCETMANGSGGTSGAATNVSGGASSAQSEADDNGCSISERIRHHFAMIGLAAIGLALLFRRR